jgi:hypothetical protein
MTLAKPEFFAYLRMEMKPNWPHRSLYSQAWYNHSTPLLNILAKHLWQRSVDASIQIAHVASKMLDRGLLCYGDWFTT